MNAHSSDRAIAPTQSTLELQHFGHYVDNQRLAESSQVPGHRKLPPLIEIYQSRPVSLPARTASLTAIEGSLDSNHL